MANGGSVGWAGCDLRSVAVRLVSGKGASSEDGQVGQVVYDAC